jgi:hypothetical protein
MVPDVASVPTEVDDCDMHSQINAGLVSKLTFLDRSQRGFEAFNSHWI